MCDSQQAVARCASTTRGASTASSTRRPRRSGRSRAGGLGFWLVTALVGSSCSSVRAQQEDYDYGGYQQQAPMRAG